MSLVKWSFIGVLLLPAAELAAFVLVAATIGWLRAAALLVATTVFGVLLLRRSGRENLRHLRGALARDGLRAVRLETPGAAAVLGAILLVVPGFITDLVGAALFLPTTRRWLSGALARLARPPKSQPRNNRIIDLDPAEWHRIPDRRPRRKRKDDL
jgi:UPF0716 protein FxsA